MSYGRRLSERRSPPYAPPYPLVAGLRHWQPPTVLCSERRDDHADVQCCVQLVHSTGTNSKIDTSTWIYFAEYITEAGTVAWQIDQLRRQPCIVSSSHIDICDVVQYNTWLEMHKHNCRCRPHLMVPAPVLRRRLDKMLMGWRLCYPHTTYTLCFVLRPHSVLARLGDTFRYTSFYLDSCPADLPICILCESLIFALS